MKLNRSTQAIFGGRHCEVRSHRGERRWEDAFQNESAKPKVKSPNEGDCSPLLAEAIKQAVGRTTMISIDPKIMQGQPCITGTRIPVTAVLRVIEHYGSLDEVVRCYPHLTREHAKQALCFSQLVLEPQSGDDEFTYPA